MTSNKACLMGQLLWIGRK